MLYFFNAEKKSLIDEVNFFSISVCICTLGRSHSSAGGWGRSAPPNSVCRHTAHGNPYVMHTKKGFLTEQELSLCRIKFFRSNDERGPIVMCFPTAEGSFYSRWNSVQREHKSGFVSQSINMYCCRAPNTY